MYISNSERSGQSINTPLLTSPHHLKIFLLIETHCISLYIFVLFIYIYLPPFIIFQTFLIKIIMGVITFESNDTYAVPPARMFKALVLESDQLFPKIFPDAIKNIDVVEGDGGAGSIKKITFAEG